MRFDYVYGKNVERDYPQITITIEEINKATADAMLETNIENRNAKREPIAKDLENGDWEINGATIVFDKLGILRDGANRLRAISKTGVPAVTIVVRGVESKAQLTMDSNVKRTVNDFLVMRGYAEATTVGAIGAALLRKDKYGIERVFHKANGEEVSTREVVNYIADIYDERIEPIRNEVRQTSRAAKVGTGVLGVLADEFRKAGGDEWIHFFRQMRLVEPQCQPVQVLTKRLLDDAADLSKKMLPKAKAAIIIKAWNAYMKGAEIGSLKYRNGGANPEDFPKIILDFD